jgi:hypothetical protein
VTAAVTAAAYNRAMTTRPVLRLIPGGRTDGDGRQSVDLYRHDTQEVRSVVWPLARLLGAIRRRRPRRPGDPDWTFSLGRRRSLAISTDGPDTFHAQATTRTADGRVAETAVRSDLSLREVEALVEAYYTAPFLLSGPRRLTPGDATAHNRCPDAPG